MQNIRPTRWIWSLLALLPLTGCFIPKEQERVTERPVMKGIEQYTGGSDKLVVIPIEGVLTTRPHSSPMSGETQGSIVERTARALRKAASDEKVKGVLLQINSPGGEVIASERIHREIRRVRERGKPVVAYFDGTAASGAYYLACAADRIVAHPVSVTGSIGVILMLPQVDGLMNKLGLDVRVIKSGAMKDAGSPFREMKEEERKVFQDLIDSMYGRFLQVVREGRPDFNGEAGLRKLADGRVYTAEQALSHKLVDELGDLEKSIETLKHLAGIAPQRQVNVIRYKIEYDALVVRLSRAQTPAQPNLQLSVNLPEGWPGAGPSFWYLWMAE